MYIREEDTKEDVALKFDQFEKSLRPDKKERPSFYGDPVYRKDIRDYEDACVNVGKGVTLYPELGEKGLDVFEKAISLGRKNSSSVGLYSALMDISQVRPDLKDRILDLTDKALSNCKNENYALGSAVFLLDDVAKSPNCEQKVVEVFSKNLNPTLSSVEGKQSVAFMYETDRGKEVLGNMNRRVAKMNASSIPMSRISRQAGD